jgi:hypothetical protein
MVLCMVVLCMVVLCLVVWRLVVQRLVARNNNSLRPPIPCSTATHGMATRGMAQSCRAGRAARHLAGAALRCSHIYVYDLPTTTTLAPCSAAKLAVGRSASTDGAKSGRPT